MATNKYELDKNQGILLSLIRAGLWEKEVQLLPYGEMDYTAICGMAEKQGVVGLVAAGKHQEHILIWWFGCGWTGARNGYEDSTGGGFDVCRKYHPNGATEQDDEPVRC